MRPDDWSSRRPLPRRGSRNSRASRADRGGVDLIGCEQMFEVSRVDALQKRVLNRSVPTRRGLSFAARRSAIGLDAPYCSVSGAQNFLEVERNHFDNSLKISLCAHFSGERAGDSPTRLAEPQRFSVSTNVLPSRAGDGETTIPAEFHRGDLALGVAFAAGDDRPGVTHAPPGRGGAARDEAHDRLAATPLGLVLQELGRVFFGSAADLADHDDGFGGVVGQNNSSTSMKSFP